MVKIWQINSWLVLVAFLLPALGGASEIFKFTDEHGVVHYTNVRPGAGQSFRTLNFPCYASDPTCRNVDWEQVPLNTKLFSDEISRAATRYAVEEPLIRAVIHAESAYQPDAESPKGAQGLMQLMPETQQDLEVINPWHPESNIDGGTYHLSRMLARFEGDLDLVAAAYNAGAGAVTRHGGVPPYSETREYVRRVRILYRRYRNAGS